ncbi:DUF1178 family protein [Candidatus Pelagibacter sp.]|nr:DUF1178 family protein [Candidatus Pelagibacter sp.]
MIKYKLICKNCKNSSDSWFGSSKEYEKLKKLKHLNCHLCNSTKVEKTLMAPNVLNSKNQNEINLDLKKYSKIKNKIREYQKFIKNNFKYVGTNFAYEARSIHYNKEKKSKPIYGNATTKEVKELKDEGINAEIIPWVKENDN